MGSVAVLAICCMDLSLAVAVAEASKEDVVFDMNADQSG
jgi:hypothetical protein